MALKDVLNAISTWFQGGPGEEQPPDPLDMGPVIVDQILGGLRCQDGQERFPYNEINLHFWAPRRRDEAVIRADLLDENQLLKRVHGALGRQNAIVPEGLMIRATFEADPEDPTFRRTGFRLDLANDAVTVRMKGCLGAWLNVLNGEVAQRRMEVGESRLNIGRLEEVVDERGRVVRRNDMSFKDARDENCSVSRRHAHLEYDQALDVHRIFDDGSHDGTVILRQGERYDVRPGSRLGLVLEDGDEIYLGKARLRYGRSPV